MMRTYTMIRRWGIKRRRKFKNNLKYQKRKVSQYHNNLSYLAFLNLFRQDEYAPISGRIFKKLLTDVTSKERNWGARMQRKTYFSYSFVPFEFCYIDTLLITYF